MRGNHLGSLSFGGQGGRVDLGRDTRRRTVSRRRGWKATQTIRTVYRKESRPAGEAGRPMRGNHLGFLSYLHYLVLLPVGQCVHLLDRGLGDLLQSPGGTL